MIGQFLNSDISQAYLDEIQANWNAARQAGVKVIPRFIYDWSQENRDASEYWCNRHIDQIAQLLQENADVIAFVEAGFFGGSG
jgi:hypothetical protein